MNFTNFGHSLIKTIEVSIGGGDGYYCTKCDNLSLTKPKICKNLSTEKTFNESNFIQFVDQYYGLVINKDDTIALIENDTQSFSENLKHIHEIEKTEDVYNTEDSLFTLLQNEHSNEFMDTQNIECKGTHFNKESRAGTIIDKQDGVWLDLWQELTATASNSNTTLNNIKQTNTNVASGPIRTKRPIRIDKESR